MWIVLTFLLLLLCVGLFLWSKRKSESAQEEISKLTSELARVREEQQDSAEQNQAHQRAIVFCAAGDCSSSRTRSMIG